MFLRGVVLMLLWCSGACWSFGASGELNAFNKAAQQFSLEYWDGAAHHFGVFITNYPTSFRVPEAILYRGEALVKAGRGDEAVELLSANRDRAGELADLYLIWIGQAHLANTNYAAAAEEFGQLVDYFPDSTNRMEAVISQATALARLEKWPEVVALLKKTERAFQDTGTASSEWIVRGYLLLGEAELRSGNPEGATAALDILNRQPLGGEPAWRRLNLQTQIELATGRMEAAQRSASNLLAQAESSGIGRLRAESVLLTGSILEKLRRPDDAVAMYQRNLTNGVPAALQRVSLLKLAELSARPEDAAAKLGEFLRENPQTETADLVLLTLGELQLKQATAGSRTETNVLLQAQSQFGSVLNRFRDSPLIGRAHLGRGWCLWYLKDFAEAQTAFRLATERLTQAEDQAVARFKLADSQFSAGQMRSALEAYQDLIATYGGHPAVKHDLIEQALYQTVRTALAITNLAAAEEAVKQMLTWYPNGLMGDRCLFLVAEEYAQQRNPAKARDLLSDFQNEFASVTNGRLPQVRLAVARTFEAEGNWAAAITNYDAWFEEFPDHPQLPEARFAHAWDTAMSGAATNALELFQAFLVAYPNHELAPRARWWIADYYFRAGDYGKAEENYPYTTNYAGSDLFYRAHLRAGAAAMARLSYKDAIAYFTTLLNDPKCPAELKIKAAIAAGDACMARNEPGATNRMADLEEAAAQFNFVLRAFPSDALAALALGRLGDCYKEMGAVSSKFYDRAAEAYGRVIAFTNASSGVRRQAQVALGVLAELKAEGKTGAEQRALLKDALAQYAEAFAQEELHVNDPADAFWFQKAGLETARLAEAIGNWNMAVNIYRRLQSVPNTSSGFQATLERRRLKALEQANANDRAEF